MMAVVVLNFSNKTGIMHARYVNSSDSGATMWFRIQIKSLELVTQYEGAM